MFRVLGRSIVACLIAATAAVPVATAAPAEAAVAAGYDSCKPVAIMAMRGSGENGPFASNTYGNVTSNGWEGGQLNGLLSLYAEYGWMFPAIRDVPVVGLAPQLATNTDQITKAYVAPMGSGKLAGYRAANLPNNADALNQVSWPDSDLWASAIDGVAAAFRQMDLFQSMQPANCALTKWVLVGYSQGAIVARLAYAHAPNRVVGVYVMGDPFQRPTAIKQIGTTNGTGIAAYRLRSIEGYQYSFDRYWGTRPVAGSQQICFANDPICDYAANAQADPATVAGNLIGSHVAAYNPFNLRLMGDFLFVWNGPGRKLADIVVAALSVSNVPAAQNTLTSELSMVSVCLSEMNSCPDKANNGFGGFVVTGMNTLISAAQIVAPKGATYDWDTGTGTFDRLDAGSAISVAYSTWGAHDVRVRINGTVYGPLQVVTYPYSWIFDTSKINFPLGVTVF